LSESSHIGGGGSPVVSSVGSVVVGSSPESGPPVAYAVPPLPPCDGSYGVVSGGPWVFVVTSDISGGSAQASGSGEDGHEQAEPGHGPTVAAGAPAVKPGGAGAPPEPRQDDRFPSPAAF
jgi:hypothetical protein